MTLHELNNVTDPANVSSMSCGAESFRNHQAALSTFVIVMAVLCSLFHIVCLAVAVATKQEPLKKAITVNVTLSGLSVTALLQPTSLVLMTSPEEYKTFRLCVGLQTFQLGLMLVFFTLLTLFFLVPVLVMQNPLRQELFRSTRGKVILLGGTWILPVLVLGVPAVAILLISENVPVACCGWHLFPKTFIFTEIYGVFGPIVTAGFYSSARFVYEARKKARETVVPVQMGDATEPGVISASRRKRHIQLRWFLLALFHLIFSCGPCGAVVVLYLHCPFCVHPELMLLVLMSLIVYAGTMLSVTNFSFKENRDTFKRLFIQCNWTNRRVSEF